MGDEKKGFWRSLFSKKTETVSSSFSETEVNSSSEEEQENLSQKRSWMTRLSSGLSKSSQFLTTQVVDFFAKKKLDRETLADLEDVLIAADLGVSAAQQVVASLSRERFGKEISSEELKTALAQEVHKILSPVQKEIDFSVSRPFVVLVVGVNGSGKTTTIGKLGAQALREGLNVLFVAGDTFRAAAVEQLKIWGERAGIPVMSGVPGADPAGLAFDALKRAREESVDVLFVDTAGRLHNKRDLMAELEKIVRVLKKQDVEAPHAVLLVLDATVGQNALLQAEFFLKSAGVTGVVMTKLDGTARGGILIALAQKFALPIYAIGVGEGIEDLQAFDAAAFSRALVGL